VPVLKVGLRSSLHLCLPWFTTCFCFWALIFYVVVDDVTFRSRFLSLKTVHYGVVWIDI